MYVSKYLYLDLERFKPLESNDDICSRFRVVCSVSKHDKTDPEQTNKLTYHTQHEWRLQQASPAVGFITWKSVDAKNIYNNNDVPILVAINKSPIDILD